MNIQMQIILNVFYYSKFIRIKYFFYNDKHCVLKYAKRPDYFLTEYYHLLVGGWNFQLHY